MRPEDIEGLTVGGLLDLVHERRPDDEALVYPDRNLRYTYASSGRSWRTAAGR